MRTWAIGVVMAGLLACGQVCAQGETPRTLAPYAAALMPLPAQPLAEKGRTYVPVYSSVMAMSGRTRIDFSVTLSVHNTSAKEPLILRRLDYFNTAGVLIEAYLERPVAIRPFGTVQINVPQDDVRGGLGGNFVVDWEASGAANEPIIEAVMLSSIGTQGYSVLSVGRRVAP
jgi:hypothetical protein